MKFGFASIGHAIATAAQDLVKAARFMGSVETEISKVAPQIESVTASFYPPAAAIERGAFYLFGLATEEVQKAGADVGPDGSISIKLTPDVIAAIRELVPAIEQFAKSPTAAVPVPATAALAPAPGQGPSLVQKIETAAEIIGAVDELAQGKPASDGSSPSGVTFHQ